MCIIKCTQDKIQTGDMTWFPLKKKYHIVDYIMYYKFLTTIIISYKRKFTCQQKQFFCQRMVVHQYHVASTWWYVLKNYYSRNLFFFLIGKEEVYWNNCLIRSKDTPKYKGSIPKVSKKWKEKEKSKPQPT